MPTVSVVIPTYNRAHLLKRAIQSVLNQTYQDFELIIVDDASTDSTEELLKEFRDERIKYIRHRENSGAGAARNTGIRTALGKYIAFQDSDDEWFPRKLEKQMNVFQTAPSKVGVVYTGFWRIENNKKPYIPFSRIACKEGDIRKQLLKENFVGTPVTLIKKECFQRAGMFDKKLPPLADWELWIRISKYYHFKYIDEPLVNVYCQPDSISADREALAKAQELILEKHWDDISKDREILSVHYSSIGSVLCSVGELKKGKYFLMKATKIRPLNIKFLLQMLFSLFGSKCYKKIVELKNKFIK